MMNREQAVDSLKQKLDQWNADLDRLESRAESFSDERRKELEETVETLKDKRKEAMDAFKRLDSASDDAFADVQEGVLEAWDKMSDSLEQARQRFN
jgi:uncharacterized coiled-coil DUF342 family protein